MTTEKPRTVDEWEDLARDLAAPGLETLAESLIGDAWRAAFALGAASRASPEEGRAVERLRGLASHTAAALRSPLPEPRWRQVWFDAMSHAASEIITQYNTDDAKAEKVARLIRHLTPEFCNYAFAAPPAEDEARDTLRALAAEFRADSDSHAAPTTAHVLANAIDAYAAPPVEDSGAREGGDP